MDRINMGQMLVAGAVAGIIIDIIFGITNGVILAPQWTDGLKGLGQPPFGVGSVVIYNLWGLIAGFAAMWIYVGFRPRFGAGARTAVYAALTVWVTNVLVPFAVLATVGLPAGLMATVAVVGLVGVVVAAIIAMHIYREA